MGATSFLGVALTCLLVSLGEGKVQRVAKRPCLRQGYNGTIYDFDAVNLWGDKNVSLSDYKGKIVVVANVATY